VLEGLPLPPPLPLPLVVVDSEMLEVLEPLLEGLFVGEFDPDVLLDVDTEGMRVRDGEEEVEVEVE